MKKTTIITFLIFTAFACRAQSKEETIKWLSQKFSSFATGINYLSCWRDIHQLGASITNNGLGVYFLDKDESIQKDPTSISVGLFNISSVKITSIPGDSCKTDLHLEFFFIEKGQSFRNSIRNFSDSSISIFFRFSDEPDLLNRIVKAFDHLIELVKVEKIEFEKKEEKRKKKEKKKEIF